MISVYTLIVISILYDCTIFDVYVVDSAYYNTRIYYFGTRKDLVIGSLSFSRQCVEVRTRNLHSSRSGFI